MPTEIYLIKVGMNMTEGVVEEWYIADGASVTEGELLYRLETEKVNMDIDAEVSGIVKHAVAEGVTLEPGHVVGHIYAAGEAIPDNAANATAAGGGSGGEVVQLPTAAAKPAAPASQDGAGGGPKPSSPAARRLAGELKVDISGLDGSGPGGRIVEADVRVAAVAPTDAVANAAAGGPSSPMARKRARELGVDLANVTGTGPRGRITKDDVESAHATASATSAAPAQTNTAPAPHAAPELLPVKGMRKIIATRMHDSLQSMAQLTMDMDVDMDDAIKLRAQLVDEWADEGVKPGYTDLIVRAAAKALQQHPRMNASWGDKAITLHGQVNVGIAVALADGLIVPVIRDANRLDVKTLSSTAARLALAARDNKLTPDDLQDGTFTVSALGMYGVDSFTPIINAPQAGILGINRIRDDIGWDGNTPVRKRVMRLSLTWDHRVLDGAPAAEFLVSVKQLLEAPFRLLV